METSGHSKRKLRGQPSKRYLPQTLMQPLSNVDSFNSSFMTSELHSQHGCDMDKVHSFFMSLNERCKRNKRARQIVRQSLEDLTHALPGGSPSKESLRIYLMMPFCDCLEEVKEGDIILHSYLDSLMKLDPYSQSIIVGWLGTLSERHFKQFVKIFKGLLGRLITDKKKHTPALAGNRLHSCTWLLDKLYQMNGSRKDNLDNESFYVQEITNCCEIERDRRSCHKDAYTKCRTNEFHFCHYPFLYDTEGKTRLLYCHNALRHEDLQNDDIFHSTRPKIQLVLLILLILSYLPLFLMPDHQPLQNLLHPPLVLLHAFIVTGMYGLISIVGLDTLNSFGHILPVRFPFSRCVCVLLCCLPVLEHLQFIGLTTLVIVNVPLIIAGVSCGILLYCYRVVLGLSTLILNHCLLYLAAYAFCWYQSTVFILDNLGLSAFFVILCITGFVCLIFPHYFWLIKAIDYMIPPSLMKNFYFLMLESNRDDVLKTTIKFLQEAGIQEFMKFHALFQGENDFGAGVDREYFTLVVDQLLDPSRGLFSSEEDSGLVWFQKKNGHNGDLFYIAGLLAGKAVNNSCNFNLPLPLAVFKKLMNIPVDFQDLKELKPVLARNLEDLLMTEGVDDYGLTFEVTQEVNGMMVTHDLCEGGVNIPVTDANKQDYVHLLVDFHLNKSIEEEYELFCAGFTEAFDIDTLKLYNFQPFEFRRTVVGKEKIDFKKLEQDVAYVQYQKNCRTIRSFWKIVHQMSLAEGKTFLRYLTGSERIPQTGLKLTIRPLIKEGENTSDLMPVAITCSYELYLPDIPDAKRLKNRLFCAIYGNQNFTSVPEALGHQLPTAGCQVLLT